MFSRIARMSIMMTAAAALVSPFAAQGGTPTPTAVQATTYQTTASGMRTRREQHPEIRKAIAALERAKVDMRRANHDFGGHRADALTACDNAIAQLRLALQNDKQ